jgi:hypothetical protein
MLLNVLDKRFEFCYTVGMTSVSTLSETRAGDVRGDVRGEFSYMDFADAPPHHHRVLRMLASGFDVEETAAVCGCVRGGINKMLRHEPFRRELERRYLENALRTAEQFEKVYGLFEDVLGLLGESIVKIRSGLEGEGVGLSDAVLALKAGQSFFEKISDRIPGNTFAKRGGASVQVNVGGGVGGVGGVADSSVIDAASRSARLVPGGSVGGRGAGSGGGGEAGCEHGDGEHGDGDDSEHGVEL